MIDPTGTTGNSGKYTGVIIAAVGALVVVGVFVFGKKILEVFNIVDTKDERRDEKVIARAENSPALKPGYKKQGQKTINYDKRQQLAKQIYDSVGYTYDDPEKMLSAIKQLENKTQVSQLVQHFQGQYQKDLFAWLKIKMDTETQKDALAQALKHIESLP